MAVLSDAQLHTFARGAARLYPVPESLLVSVAIQESGGDPAKRGRAGEYGLMQLMPATAQDMGFVGDAGLLLSPVLSMNLGAKYLAWQFQRFGNWEDALSAYNAGHPIGENRATYVAPILKRAGEIAGAAGSLGIIALALGLAALLASRKT